MRRGLEGLGGEAGPPSGLSHEGRGGSGQGALPSTRLTGCRAAPTPTSPSSLMPDLASQATD